MRSRLPAPPRRCRRPGGNRHGSRPVDRPPHQPRDKRRVQSPARGGGRRRGCRAIRGSRGRGRRGKVRVDLLGGFVQLSPSLALLGTALLVVRSGCRPVFRLFGNRGLMARSDRALPVPHSPAARSVGGSPLLRHLGKLVAVRAVACLKAVGRFPGFRLAIQQRFPLPPMAATGVPAARSFRRLPLPARPREAVGRLRVIAATLGVLRSGAGPGAGQFPQTLLGLPGSRLAVLPGGRHIRCLGIGVGGRPRRRGILQTTPLPRALR